MLVIYVDVLVALNIITTYFILLATKRILRITARTVRLALSALVGGISSLYIFFPQSAFLSETLIKLFLSAVIVYIAFGYGSLKKYFRAVFSFFAASFIYAGFMLGFWYVARPAGMVINNGFVYFSISPIVLITSTVLCYFAIILAQRFYKREDVNAVKKEVILHNKGSEFSFECMVDTGNSISDPMGDSKIIILGRNAANIIFGKDNVDSVLKMSVRLPKELRYRVIPYKTAMGRGLLPIVSIDGAEVDNMKTNRVAVGILANDFGDIDGIISPNFFE